MKTEQLRKTSESLKKRNKEVKRLRCAGHGTYASSGGAGTLCDVCVDYSTISFSPNRPPTPPYLPPSYPSLPPPMFSPPSPPPREALSSVQGSMASMVSHSSVQAAGMQQLQERLGQVQAGQYGWEEGVRGGAGRRGWEEGLTTPVMCVQWMRQS